MPAPQQQEGSRNHRHCHRLRPHPRHGAFTDRIQQFLGCILPQGGSPLPGLFQIAQHDDAELGRHAGQRERPRRRVAVTGIASSSRRNVRWRSTNMMGKVAGAATISFALARSRNANCPDHEIERPGGNCTASAATRCISHTAPLRSRVTIRSRSAMLSRAMAAAAPSHCMSSDRTRSRRQIRCGQGARTWTIRDVLRPGDATDDAQCMQQPGPGQARHCAPRRLSSAGARSAPPRPYIPAPSTAAILNSRPPSGCHGDGT
jgi:hypothetical protein